MITPLSNPTARSRRTRRLRAPRSSGQREARVHFRQRLLPYLLIAPQLAVTVVFFLWPAGRALWGSFLRSDAWGFRSTFVGLENYLRLFADPLYLQSFWLTMGFSLVVTFSSLALGLVLAASADFILRGAKTYRTLLMWPYAVAPALAGALWYFMFNPSLGVLSFYLQALGYGWNHTIRGGDALALVTIASVWKQIGYNFLFFLAGLQSMPRSLIEAAAIDGAGPLIRFWRIAFPLLAPVTFFLLVVNGVYAFFDTFGVIHATTGGGPIQATTILVLRVFKTGFLGQDLGSSAAQSVVLMALVIGLTVLQFRFIERRVHY